MSTATGKISIQIQNPDGSVINLAGILGNAVVTTTPANTEPVIPRSALTVDMLPASIAWQMNHDAGTPGSATGTTTYPVTNPADKTVCRQFQFTLTAGGGEIYHVKVLDNSSAYDTFCYEAVESSPDWSNVACIEKDFEQAGPDGIYVDMATQLNGHAGVIDVTSNHAWMGTGIAANPMKRASNKLHTTRVYVQNLGGGKVLYIGIFLDGVYYPLNITALSQSTVAWGANILNLQLQYDGLSSGSVETTVYMSVLKVHCWKS